MPLLYDPQKVTLQITVNKQTNAVNFETSEDVPFPAFVSLMAATLQNVTERFMAAAVAAPVPPPPGGFKTS